MARQPTRTARESKRVAPRHRAAGGTLLGIFIGLVMGLALAASVAYYLGGRSVYQAQVQAAQKDAHEPATDAAKGALVSADKSSDKPRFDFYKILPGGEEPKIQAGAAPPVRPDRASADRAAEKSAERKDSRAADAATPAARAVDKSVDKVAIADPLKGARAGDRFWLQVGSFTDQADAENMKARLALGGLQAAVQQGMLADKSVRYRVRLGPYDNTDELTRVKNQLAQQGQESAAIKY
ncbi:MAG: SPOR domain-containing protein [Casimicrobiaceae bacterium]